VSDQHRQAAFASVVKDALERLYDPARLAEHELARVLLPRDLDAGLSRAQALRQVLLETIGKLDYGSVLPSASRERRLHRVLELRYVEALPIREVMGALALSEAQYHREQRHAVEALAALLWERRRSDAVGADPTARSRPAADPDVRPRSAKVDLGGLMPGAIDVLRSLAQARRVDIRAEPAGTTVARGDRTTLRQLLISAGSYVLQAAHDGELTISCRRAERSAVVAFDHRGAVSDAVLRGGDAADRLAAVERLLGSARGTYHLRRVPGRLTFGLSLPGEAPALLVIDDNPDMLRLIERYLETEEYAVYTAERVTDGLRAAQAARPDLILLDVMMPEQDGWEALQALKHHPATQDVPVLVCTVLPEAQLALSLGAVGLLRKPLTRPALLEAVAPWLRRLPSAEGRPGAPGPYGEAGSPGTDGR
jgi:CheY-like chemotaxis protein